jgi:hypothetical protein
LSNAYDKLDRRLKGEDENASQPAHTSANMTNAPRASQGQGYIAPREGYVPHPPSAQQPAHRPQPQPARQSSQPPVSPVWHPSDDRDHPLHRHYRKRMRGVRVRWFGSGIFMGVLVGIFVTLLASALVVTQIPTVLQTLTGDPDLAVAIGENYLNQETTTHLQNSAPMTVGPLKLTSLTLDVKPNNRMDLHPQFSADVILTTLNFDASVQNELTVKDGKLVINMIGDPQIGTLNVPLDLLPFNLKDSTRQAVDQIDNDVLAAEINRTLDNASSGTGTTIDGVTTTETTMTILMHRK